VSRVASFTPAPGRSRTPSYRDAGQQAPSRRPASALHHDAGEAAAIERECNVRHRDRGETGTDACRGPAAIRAAPVMDNRRTSSAWPRVYLLPRISRAACSVRHSAGSFSQVSTRSDFEHERGTPISATTISPHRSRPGNNT